MKHKQDLLDIIDRFSDKKIAVWGDFLLDEYLYGTTERISREAPVLVLRYRSRDFFLGGAGNSLLNLKALGAVPIPVGVIGSDEAGDRILQILKEQGISSDMILVDKDYSTPLKTRILAGEESTRKQQILRIDHEGIVPDRKPLLARLKAELSGLSKETQGLLLSDYNYMTIKKSLFSEILPLFKNENIPVTLDSRFRIFDFPGVTLSTPNEPEVEEALHTRLDGDAQRLSRSGRTLLKRTAAEALLITRGSNGMALFETGKPPVAIPVHGTTDIVDVTGAGDTVISVITLALACGASFRQAARLANYAGGQVVMKKGTATVSCEELKEVILSKS
jgi:D-glycero-beta-D-manno-heptose-7-phosphate kinase